MAAVSSSSSAPSASAEATATATTTLQSEKWSKAANSYVKYFQPSGVVIGRYLLNCLRLQYQPKPQLPPQHNIDIDGDGNGLKVLEAGCGAGALAKDLLLLDGLSVSELVVTDISDGMLEKARTALLGMMRNDSSETEAAAAAETTATTTATAALTVNGVKVRVVKDDFTNFQSMPTMDGYFDRYYANMCLCYANDPDAVLKETCRVLKPNGLAGFTAWGRSDDSPLMTIVPTVLKDLKLVSEDDDKTNSGKKKRSTFHLGEDDAALRERFFNAGFSKCTVIHFPAAMECFDPDSYVELIIDGAPSTKAQVESFSKDDQEIVRKEVHDRAAVILNQGLPMSLDIVIAVAQK